jgi:hypothetical protein
MICPRRCGIQSEFHQRRVRETRSRDAESAEARNAQKRNGAKRAKNIFSASSASQFVSALMKFNLYSANLQSRMRHP